MQKPHFYSKDLPGFGEFIRRHIARFPMSVELIASYLAFVDPKTPAWAKAIIGAAIAYVICPLDAIPDIIPIAGWTDDIAVMGGVLAGAAKCFITEGHRRKARSILGLD